MLDNLLLEHHVDMLFYHGLKAKNEIPGGLNLEGSKIVQKKPSYDDQSKEASSTGTANPMLQILFTL
ncbi:hypothetical protein MKZ38_005168 [Zalerion maritima]|uniref:Uncharacterized protein n=1 Tax=Zalerion maritima TaxID=339359 RepID=A0AAD5RY88_9PEZI|nr:hypothetical protein MKZ38_005168 [Zalerion maritima]